MEKDRGKVSIIVPIYNVQDFLGECIESIIAQTYQNIEIILVDDGSSDNSGEIADNYAKADSRVKVIHQQNLGVSAARNTGIDNATSIYLCFADGDDYLMPDYIEYLLELLLDNNADISLTTEMFGNYKFKQVANEKTYICSGEDAAVKIMCYGIPIGVYCKMFRRSFLENKIRFLTDLFIGEGFNFNTTAFQNATTVAIGNRRIYYYRRNNPTSATTKFSIKKWKNGLMAIDVIKQNFIIKSDKLNKAWQYAYWRTHSDVYDLMILAAVEKKYPEMYNKCLHVIRSQAMCAFKVPTSAKERTRALIMKVFPRLIPKLMLLRRMKYHVDVEN